MKCLCAVHSNKSSHEAHNHPDSMLAAVYYPETAPDGAKLVLYDPRGVSPWEHLREHYGRGEDSPVADLPPFTKRWEFEPSAGDLIIFPGWLVHEVLPATQSHHAPRVSFPFNLQGDWHD